MITLYILTILYTTEGSPYAQEYQHGVYQSEAQCESVRGEFLSNRFDSFQTIDVKCTKLIKQ